MTDERAQAVVEYVLVTFGLFLAALFLKAVLGEILKGYFTRVLTVLLLPLR